VVVVDFGRGLAFVGAQDPPGVLQAPWSGNRSLRAVWGAAGFYGRLRTGARGGGSGWLNFLLTVAELDDGAEGKPEVREARGLP
jgi:hypothetical protein